MKKLFFSIIAMVIAVACTKNQNGAYNDIQLGVNEENYYKQIDSLVSINKLAWQGDKEKVAYSVQTVKGKSLYLYLVPTGKGIIESLRVDAMPRKVPISSLIGSRLMGDISTDPSFSEIDDFILNQLKEKYGGNYQEDSTQVVVDSAPIISFDNKQVYVATLKTKLWNTESYKISMEHYICQHAHKISILYIPIVKNSNQF